MKIGAAAVMSSCICLLLKKQNPELALPLVLAVCAGAFTVMVGLLGPILKLLEEAKRLSGLSDMLFYPVVKSVGIGFCARLTGELCGDSGQCSLARCVEPVAAVCALYAALPLMETLLDMLEELV